MLLLCRIFFGHHPVFVCGRARRTPTRRDTTRHGTTFYVPDRPMYTDTFTCASSCSSTVLDTSTTRSCITRECYSPNVHAREQCTHWRRWRAKLGHFGRNEKVADTASTAIHHIGKSPFGSHHPTHSAETTISSPRC